jgi:hypothetical protein
MGLIFLPWASLPRECDFTILTQARLDSIAFRYYNFGEHPGKESQRVGFWNQLDYAKNLLDNGFL